MATYLLSQVLGQVLAFNPKTDMLRDDLGSAADLSIGIAGGDLFLGHGASGVTLSNLSVGQLGSANIQFADGSLLLVGNDNYRTPGDNSANVLLGGAGDDRLVGLGGNDSLDGGEGADAYLVFGTAHGADLYHDTGVSGIDRIEAGADATAIGLGNAFSAVQTGIEVITGNGFAGVSIVGTGKADSFDFSGVTLDGIAVIDTGGAIDHVVGSAGADLVRAGAGNDVVSGADGNDVLEGGTGSDSLAGGNGDDVIAGGVGNDGIDGGAGTDIVQFAGARAGYAITTVGSDVQVRDTAAKVDGNDGTDLLHDVEILCFADGDVVLAPPPNHAPLALDDTGSVTADGSTALLDVLANDSDPDAGDHLSLLAASVGAGQGSVSILGDQLAFDPGSDFRSLAAGVTTGVVASYTVQDTEGATDTANVTLTVTGVNDGPVAVDDAAAATEDGGAVTVGVLANDSDVDAGDQLSLVAAGVGAGQGSVAILGNQLVFDPGSDFQALGAGVTTDVVASYTVQDAAGATATGNLTLTVTGANDGPLVVDDLAATTVGAAPLGIDVLANDSDPDAGDAISLVSASVDPGFGSVSVLGNQLVFDPGSDFAGLGAGESMDVTASYIAQDSAGATSGGLVTVTVNGVNDAPVATPDSADVGNALPTAIDVLGNDYDPDSSDLLSLATVSVPAGQGTVSIVGNQLVFDPGSDFATLGSGDTATVTASYTVTDPSGVSAAADAVITVHGSGGTPGGDPFTVIAPSQIPANAGAIVDAIMGTTPGITSDPTSLTWTAAPSSVMFYDGSLAPLGIGPGLLITSGTEPGLANTVGYFGVDNGMPGNAALDSVVNTVFSTQSFDATMLGFTINVTDPAITGVRMNVVFGSDEFPEWVDAFVDIGVVLANGVNVAYFNNDPMAPLSIIGSNLAANYFIDNTGNLDTPSFGGVAVPGVPSAFPIEYDGFSPVLSILAPVHPGINTIQIGIADTGDHIYDSGLFISNLTGTTFPGGGGGVVIDVPCTPGNDDKTGSDASEIFDCAAGNDTISGNGGADIALGGAGNDTLDGGADNDALDGGADDDTLTGGAGDDSIGGGDGIDTAIFAGQLGDYDIVDLGNGEFIVTDNQGTDGIDVLTAVELAWFQDGLVDLSTLPGGGGGGGGADDGVTIYGTAEDDLIDGVTALPGQPVATDLNDLLYGGDGDDTLLPGDGDDDLWGDAGNDTLDGGAGHDMLMGGAGEDELTGGTGADRFAFASLGDLLADTAAGVDIILDFASAEGDRLDLAGVDADIGSAQDDAFVLAASFTGAAGQLIQVNAGDSHLFVMGDVDGDAVADFAIKIENTAGLNAGDFWL